MGKNGKKFPRVVLASRNPGKVKELTSLLSPCAETMLSLIHFPELTLVAETGSTYEENAIAKAKFAVEGTGLPAIGEDTGLEIDALDHAPGLLTRRWAGTDVDRIRRVLTALDGMPPSKRGARFVCAVAFAEPDGKVVTAKGVWKGKIAVEPRGRDGFGYDPIFIPDGKRRTNAEISITEKNCISHRALAIKALFKRLHIA